MPHYECPTCLLSKLDLFLPVTPDGILVPPRIVPIMNQSFNSHCNKTQYEVTFELTKEQFLSKSSKEIYIRCIKLDGKSMEHAWPLYGRLCINSKVIETFWFPKDLVSCKRNDQPRLFKYENFKVCLNKLLIVRSNSMKGLNEKQKKLLAEDEKNQYVFSMMEVECLNVKLLIERILASNKPTIEESRKIFMEKLESQYKNIYNDECICEEPFIEVPWSDPYLPETIIEIPAYGKYCKHIQPFDLTRFIQMNERAKLWKCPYCNEKILDIVVDTYYQEFLSIIKGLNLQSLKITVNRDGEFYMNNDSKVIFVNNAFSITNLNNPNSMHDVINFEEQKNEGMASKIQGSKEGIENKSNDNVIMDGCTPMTMEKSQKDSEKKVEDPNDSDDVIFVSENAPSRLSNKANLQSSLAHKSNPLLPAKKRSKCNSTKLHESKNKNGFINPMMMQPENFEQVINEFHKLHGIQLKYKYKSLYDSILEKKSLIEANQTEFTLPNKKYNYPQSTTERLENFESFNSFVKRMKSVQEDGYYIPSKKIAKKIKPLCGLYIEKTKPIILDNSHLTEPLKYCEENFLRKDDLKFEIGNSWIGLPMQSNSASIPRPIGNPLEQTVMLQMSKSNQSIIQIVQGNNGPTPIFGQMSIPMVGQMNNYPQFSGYVRPHQIPFNSQNMIKIPINNHGRAPK